MGKNQYIGLFSFLLLCTSAFASNPFEKFIGVYQVKDYTSCATEDLDCKALKSIRIERLAGTPLFQIVELKGTKEVATRLIEISCPGLDTCNEFSNTTGDPQGAAWDYSKTVPSAVGRYDGTSFRSSRRLTNYDGYISYESFTATNNGADTVIVQRMYGLKKVRALTTLGSLDDEGFEEELSAFE